ncbi:hypothetical protein BDV3_006119 [Batrachochytrium dendrobatidis]
MHTDYRPVAYKRPRSGNPTNESFSTSSSATTSLTSESSSIRVRKSTMAHSLTERAVSLDSTTTLTHSMSGLFKDDAEKRHQEHETAQMLPWWSSNRLVYYKFDECPEYLRDNDCILTKYRAHQTYKEAWISTLHLHNETGNIWTHLAPFFIAMTGMILHLIYYDLHPNATYADYIAISVYLGCAAYTFITSSLFHMHLGVSPTVFIFFGCLDYSGISASIFGGSATTAYYFLYCDPNARIGWISALVVVNLVGIIGPIFKFWSGASFRAGRAIVYLSSGACSCAPIMYYLAIHGVKNLPSIHTSFAIPGILLMLFLYTFGVIIYVFRIPERFAPGFFDLAFHSHMNWHIFVMTACWMLYAALLDMMKWRLAPNHTCEA